MKRILTAEVNGSMQQSRTTEEAMERHDTARHD